MSMVFPHTIGRHAVGERAVPPPSGGCKIPAAPQCEKEVHLHTAGQEASLSSDGTLESRKV